jgi:endonuclease/exonuclease/phosphatase family metal-dependent hydrolase
MYKFFVSLIFLIFIFTACEQEPLAPETQQQQTSQAEQIDGWGHHARGLKVMTRNIYIGTDVDIVLGATDPSEIPFLAAQAFETLMQTNFYWRAHALAGEIARTKPQIIGLQEVSLIRMQIPGDYIYGGTEPAKKVLFDYLKILRKALKMRGLHYRVAGMIQNADVEIPMFAGVDPETGQMKFNDIRVTDFDVTMVRKDVHFSNVVEQNYMYYLQIPVVTPLNEPDTLHILRGFVAADVTVCGKTYRFVNTHLEPFVEVFRELQAAELLSTLGFDKPVIMVGDFNTPAPPEGELGENTYEMILQAGFSDVWKENVLTKNPDGFTFGHDPDLLNPTAQFWERIDYIFVRKMDLPVYEKVYAHVVGDEQIVRNIYGMWPSDHGGVVAKLISPKWQLAVHK